MPFKEVPKEFNKKQMRSKEEKTSKMEENELRIHSHGIKSFSIEKIFSSPPVGISDNINPARLNIVTAAMEASWLEHQPVY